MNTLNLQASKAIQALGVRVPTQQFWYNDYDENVCLIIKNGKELDGKIVAPAPNLQELFTILPEIGEKLGWDTLDPHTLLDIFLEKGMSGVSEEIIRLVENK